MSAFHKCNLWGRLFRRMPLVHLDTEGLRTGFWGKPPADLQTVVEACRSKAFLNFDDEAFGPALHRYLAQEFPAPSSYERPDEVPTPLRRSPT
jgi:hypothetical protein